MFGINRYLIICSLCLIGAFVPKELSGQEKNHALTGIVLDENNEPLVGASVIVIGTDRGEITNSMGEFSLDELSRNDTISVSFLGYITQDVPVNGKKKVSVKLMPDELMLEETQIVAVGYGDVRRRDLTGAISKANMDEMLKVPTTNVGSLLGGRVAGVQVTSPDGGLTEDFNVVIRGAGSLTQSTEPLYVIDGFPTEASGFGTLNVNDIESIDILKDASATAIYGSRGANGVVIITTKSNNYNARTSVTYNGSVSVSTLTNPVELMDGYDFVCLQKEIYGDAEKTVDGVKVNAFEYLYLRDGLTLEDYKKLPQYDWQSELYRTAISHNHHVSMMGSANNLKYSASIAYSNKQGIIINSGLDKYQGRLNLTQKFKRLTITANTSYASTVQNGANPSSDSGGIQSMSVLYSTWAYRPVSPSGDDLLEALYDEDVDMTNDYRFNPVLSAKNEYRKNTTSQFNANISIDWNILDNLIFKVVGGYMDKRLVREEFNGSKTQTGNSYPSNTRSKGINATLKETAWKNFLNEYTFSYSLNRGRHHLTTLLGASLQMESRNYHSIYTEYITSESFGMSGLDNGNPPVISSSVGENRLLSAFGRVNYNYGSKYYMTATFRADGSSKFAPEHRWGYFPSVSFAWTFSRERFIVRNLPWLSNGKLRVSWGLTGNNRVGNYDYIPQLITDSKLYRYPWDGTPYPGYIIGNAGNKNLKWETTQQYNIGLDLGLLRGKLNIIFDYYVKLTQDLLLNTDVPLSSGFAKSMMNVGELQNSGFEITVQADIIKRRNFSWSSNFNIAFNKNVITALSSGQQEMKSFVNWNTAYSDSPAYISVVGGSAGNMYGFKYLGTYKYDDFDMVADDAGNMIYTLKEGIPYYVVNTQPGDPKYDDLNHDGKITDEDMTIIGNGQPIMLGGMSNEFIYKNWDLNIFLQWNYGNDILNANRMIFENPQGKKNTNMFKSYKNRWSPENPDSDMVRSDAVGSSVYSSLYVESGSYFKIKSISLGYTFNILKKTILRSVKLYLAAENILTLTKYSGGDPEVSTRHSVLTPGFDWSAYPRAFNMSLGLNIKF